MICRCSINMCRMAHMRGRFQKVLLQGKYDKARSFMEWVIQLYALVMIIFPLMKSNNEGAED